MAFAFGGESGLFELPPAAQKLVKSPDSVRWKRVHTIAPSFPCARSAKCSKPAGHKGWCDAKAASSAAPAPAAAAAPASDDDDDEEEMAPAEDDEENDSENEPATKQVPKTRRSGRKKRRGFQKKSVRVQEDSEWVPDSPRKAQKCSKCGLPRRGHTCTGSPPASSEHATGSPSPTPGSPRLKRGLRPGEAIAAMLEKEAGATALEPQSSPLVEATPLHFDQTQLAGRMVDVAAAAAELAAAAHGNGARARAGGGVTRAIVIRAGPEADGMEEEEGETEAADDDE